MVRCGEGRARFISTISNIDGGTPIGCPAQPATARAVGYLMCGWLLPTNSFVPWTDPQSPVAVRGFSRGYALQDSARLSITLEQAIIVACLALCRQFLNVVDQGSGANRSCTPPAVAHVCGHHLRCAQLR